MESSDYEYLNHCFLVVYSHYFLSPLLWALGAGETLLFFFFSFLYLTAIMWSSSSLSSRLNKIIWSNFSIWHYDSSQHVCYICPNLLHIPLLLCPKFCSFILFFINANFMGFVCTSTQHHFSCLGITMSNPWIPSYRTVHKPVKFCSCTVY